MKRAEQAASRLLFASHRSSKIMGPPVKLLHRPALAVVFAIVGASQVFSQDQLSAGDDATTPPNTAILPANATTVLTGKERLGRKWMDEQRIDNCKVPIDRQGAKPRSSACPHVPTG